MGYRHDRDSILDAAVDFVRANGLSALTYGKLARELGIADRTIVYYFPWKAKLVEAVIGTVVDDVQELMAGVVGDDPVSLRRLLVAAWPLLQAPEAAVTFGLVIEIAGLAGADVEPYATLASRLAADRVGWLADRLDAPTEEERRSEAAAAVAAIDGLMLVRLTAGADVADGAARALSAM
jgi:AcrR family transcriptional regulator